MTSRRTVPWREDLRDFFSHAPADLAPPRAIETFVNAARDRLTLIGRFERSDGLIVKLTTRCSRKGEDWFVDEEHLDLRVKFGADR
jgi:hypothetical protein